MKRKGCFITFEGIDGSGKTTQLKLAERFLRKHGLPVLVLREPGSTPLSERIRRILLDKRMHISPVAELNLYLAARAELVEDVIAPALKEGRVILCDRFHDSTTAYQGYGRGLDIAVVEKMNRLAIGLHVPDLTLFIDVTYAVSLGRRKKKSDRLESESRAFFNKVRHGFLEIAARDKKRVTVIDGSPTVDEIFAEVRTCLQRKLKIK